MGYQLPKTKANDIFHQWAQKYDIFAPKLMEGEGCFSDTDIIRYGKVSSLDEIEWGKKSDYSFKEVLLAINETLFYFTEDQTTVPKGPEKDILIFLRSCDLHAVKRLDEIYLKNGFEDFYYARIRNRAKFILMGCETTCSSGFCVSMGTNRSDNYDAYMKVDGETVYMDLKWEELIKDVAIAAEQAEVTPAFVTENKEKVTLPRNLSNESFTKEIWKEYEILEKTRTLEETKSILEENLRKKTEKLLSPYGKIENIEIRFEEYADSVRAEAEATLLDRIDEKRQNQ